MASSYLPTLGECEILTVQGFRTSSLFKALVSLNPTIRLLQRRTSGADVAVSLSLDRGELDVCQAVNVLPGVCGQ